MSATGERVSVFAPAIPGLPSGYTGIARDLVEASQRQRLLHGVTTVVAEKGYGAATVADIAAQAGVSKKTFYEHYPDKAACFLAAYDHGRDAMLARVVAASREHRGDPVEQLRASTRAYLQFLVDEAPYARTFFLEILAAGPAAVARQRDCRAAFTAGLQEWHRRARRRHRDWPKAGPIAYEAATGAAHELALGRIATGREDDLLALEAEIVDVQLAVLRVPAA